jgi:hypothetical protein
MGPAAVLLRVRLAGTTIKRRFAMRLARRFFVLAQVFLFLSAAGPLSADSVKIIDSEGGTFDEANDVLVAKEEKNHGHHSVTYWFVTDRGTVSWASMGFYENSGLRFVISRLSFKDRLKVISDWKDCGRSAKITPLNGIPEEVSNIWLRSIAPSGYQWYQGSSRTNRVSQTSLTVSDGQTEKSLPISTIKRIALDGNKVSVTLQDGKQVSGEFVWPSVEGEKFELEWNGVLYDSKGNISEFSIPFQRVSVLEFR